ncbi:MAG: anthranilate phosphoribosyltransferase [Clostridium sp.]|jgi:anthranilate synthase/phosphoribosyltransferase|nr:anthranilate phosphoribosyltransferase [Clostridium sp.]
MILLIDNYDSFSYNVYQLIGTVLQEAREGAPAGTEPFPREDPAQSVQVIRNRELTPEEIEALAPTHIVISPGPGKPSEAGQCEAVIRHFAGKVPILGICLGHQAICEVFGAKITYAKALMHGKQSSVYLDVGSRLFRGMEKRIRAGRYHSLAAEPETVPEELKITARAEIGEVMAVEHVKYPVYGVQFHPESILTEGGKKIMENFLLPEREEKKHKELAIREAIARLSRREDIGYAMSKEVMNEIMSGSASEVQKSAYLTALGLKGETIEEITGSAEEMRNHSVKLEPGMDVLEIVGTGGDGSNSFNISTTASLLIAAAGVPVAKHGNRAASSKSGAADCLEALGVNILLPPEQNKKLLEEIGICFLFAQKYHTAMKHVAPVRRELGIRTVFNILGPLANPAGANMQIMGVYEEALLEPMAKVLTNLGVKRGMVVFGQDRLDEISVSAPTSICEIREGEYRYDTITPEQFGMRRCAKEELVGGTPLENAEITRAILKGEKGAKRDAAVLNAAAALYIAGKARDLREGADLAESMIDSGKALELLEKFIRLSNEASG